MRFYCVFLTIYEFQLLVYWQTKEYCDKPESWNAFCFVDKSELRHVCWCYCNNIYMSCKSDIFCFEVYQTLQTTNSTKRLAFDKLWRKNIIVTNKNNNIASCSNITIFVQNILFLKSIPTITSEQFVIVIKCHENKQFCWKF